MKKKPFDQLLDIYANNNVVSEERIALKEVQDEKSKMLYREKNDKVYEVKQKYDAKMQKCEDEKDRIDAVADKKIISKYDLEKKIKLRTIVDHLLTDASCSYGHGHWKEEDVVKEIDGNLFTVTILIEENNNKVNKFNLRFYVGFKYYYLSDYFKDILIGCYDIFFKAFKTKEDAEAYAEKNINKIMSPLWKTEDELFKSIQNFKYNVLEEFDFRGVRHNISQQKLIPISKTEAKFSIGYEDQICNVQYLGNGKFIVNNKDKELIEKLKSAIAWGKVCRIPENLITIEISVPA